MRLSWIFLRETTTGSFALRRGKCARFFFCGTNDRSSHDSRRQTHEPPAPSMSKAAIQHMQRVTRTIMASDGRMQSYLIELRREFTEYTRALDAREKRDVLGVLCQEIATCRYLDTLKIIGNREVLHRIAFFLSTKHRQPVPPYDATHVSTSATYREVLHLHKKMHALVEAEVTAGAVMTARMSLSTMATFVSRSTVPVAGRNKSNIAHRLPTHFSTMPSASPKGIYVQAPRRRRPVS